MFKKIPIKNNAQLAEIFRIFVVSRLVYVIMVIGFSKLFEFKIDSMVSCRFDCWWYYDIIQNGYMSEVLTEGQVGAANWAFFPTFPILVRGLGMISPINPVITGIILNQILFILFLITINKYIQSRYPSFDLKTFNILYCFSPFSIYFNSLYSETLFVFLLAALIHQLSRANYLRAGLLGGFLSGTRSLGVLYMGLFFFQTLKNEPSEGRKIWFKLGGLLLFPLGLIIFSVHMYMKTGNPFSYITIQKAKAWGWPSENFFQWILILPHSNSPRQWSYLFCILLSIACCYYLFRKHYFVEFYVLMCPTLLSIATNKINYRYFFVFYPAYFVATLLFGGKKLNRIVLIVFNFVLLCVFTSYWILGSRFLV